MQIKESFIDRAQQRFPYVGLGACEAVACGTSHDLKRFDVELVRQIARSSGLTPAVIAEIAHRLGGGPVEIER